MEDRIWSAACSTDEEPYSITILLRKLLPSIEEWSITSLATDINVRFLRRAEEGRYADAAFDQYISIIVSDTGEGMTEETQNRIFEPFYTTKEPGKGTGLGMSVVYGVVMGHEGKIALQSEPGKGTTFSLYFPVKERISGEVVERKKRGENIPGGNETILVVEDEEMLRELVKVVLASKGYRVITAEDGIAALEQYDRGRNEIALVISDIGLPRLDGVELMKSLREKNPAVKIIMATGYLDPKARDAMAVVGSYEVIQKPYQPDGLLWKVRKVLEEKE